MCGIIAIFHPEHSALETAKGLLTLQHRGQDGVGLFNYDKKFELIHLLKQKGEALNLISSHDWSCYHGSMSIGHTRYATVGVGNEKELQPHFFRQKSDHHFTAFAHNGNIINTAPLRLELTHKGYEFESENDIEVLQKLFDDAPIKSSTSSSTSSTLQKVAHLTAKAIGGYAVVAVLENEGLIAFRDPQGIRPLILGQKKIGDQQCYALASESLTLDFLGYTIIEDVAPGELITIDFNGVLTRTTIPATNHINHLNKKSPSPCFFEWIYFSSPETVMEKAGVYDVRLKLGTALAHTIRPMIERGEISPDLVAPVPDTGRIGSATLAEQLGLPCREILIKNRYIKRSFILPTLTSRQEAIAFKYNLVKSQIIGKSILLVDDSIVRGSTAVHLIALIRKAGAKKIYFVSTCPPIRFPCFYGLDFPNQSELLASNKTIAEMEAMLGIDKLIYLPETALTQAIGIPSLCKACVTGHYPTDISFAETFKNQRSIDRQEINPEVNL